MKTNLSQRLAVALASTKMAASILAKLSNLRALSKQEKDVLEIALGDKSAAQEIERVLKARANVVSKEDEKNLAEEALLADPDNESLADDVASADIRLIAAQAAKSALVPMSKETRSRIIVALADDKAGAELISKIEA